LGGLVFFIQPVMLFLLRRTLMSNRFRAGADGYPRRECHTCATG
jgi:hypothetical protein